MLNDWLDAIKYIGLSPFERGSSGETWGLAILFVFIIMVVFKVVSKVLGSTGRAFFVLFPGFILMISSAAAVRAFSSQQWIFQAAAAVLALLVLVVPLTKSFQKVSWATAILIWLITLAASAGVIYAESIIAGALERGSSKGSALQERRDSINQLMKDGAK